MARVRGRIVFGTIPGCELLQQFGMRWYIVITIALACVPGAFAKTGDGAGDCLNGKIRLDPKVQAASRAIDAPAQSNAARAAALLRRGAILDARGYPECALHDYDAAIELNPGMAEAFVARGAIWVRKNEIDRAMAEFEAAGGANPKYAPAFFMQGIVWRQRGDPDRAIAGFDRALDIDPKYAAALHARARAWGDKREFKNEIADYDALLALDPKNPRLYVERGNVHDDNGDSERALADYATALKLDPNYANAYTERGVALIARRDYERAAADFDAALRLNPKNAGALKGRGRAQFYRGRFEAAAADFARCGKLGADPYCFIWLYLARSRAGADAAAELAKDAANVPADSWPGRVLALYRGAIGPAQLAAKAADPNPITQRDQACEAQFYGAQWYLLRGERAEARSRFEAAARDCPRDFIERSAAAAELERLK